MKKIRIILVTVFLLLAVVLVSCSDTTDVNDGDVTDGTTGDTEENPAETTSADTVVTDESEDGINVYRIKKLASVDEIDWISVPAVAIDTYKWVECEPVEAYAQLVYIDNYGFVCRMIAIESNPFSRYTEFGDPACLDSCLEFFVTIDGEKYINIEANSIGALYVGIGASRKDHTTADKILSKDEMVKVTPVIEDDKWSIIIDLPLDKLEALYGKEIPNEQFSSGFTFGGNFYKTESADNGNEHYGMWNEVKTDIGDFHRPDYFGKFIIE